MAVGCNHIITPVPRLDELPDDVLALIYAYLRHAPLYAPVSLSTGLGHALALSRVNSRLWQVFKKDLSSIHLVFTQSRHLLPDISSCTSLIRIGAPNLQTLSLCGQVPHQLLRAISSIDLQIRDLHISTVDCFFDEQWASLFDSLANTLQSVTVWNVRNFGELSMRKMAQRGIRIRSLALGKLSSVKPADVSFLLRVGGAQLQSLSVDLAFCPGNAIALNCHSLETLILGGSTGADAAVRACEANRKSLKVVRFDGIPMHAMDVRDVVQKCPLLTEVYTPSLSAAMTAEIVGARLRKLFLSGSSASAEELRIVAEKCVNIEEIVVEYFQDSILIDGSTDATEALVQLCVKIGPRLRSLSLWNVPELDDKALGKIGKAACKLQYLDVDGLEDITREGLEDALSYCGKSLKRIGIGQFCRQLSNVCIMEILSRWCPNLEYVSFPRWGCATRISKENALGVALSDFRRCVPFATIQQEHANMRR